MHIIFREKKNIDELETPIDLNQTPGDVIVLSFSDSDLNAFAAGWKRANKLAKGKFPSLRLANLQNLKHPLSIDTYIEKTLSKSKAIIIRLIGGIPYWEYGLNQVKQIAEKNDIALAVLPADGRKDSKLSNYSNIPPSSLKILKSYCDIGGTIATHAALSQILINAGIFTPIVNGDKSIPKFGFWFPNNQIKSKTQLKKIKKPSVLIVFYRSFVTASDLEPIKVLIEKFKNIKIPALACFVPSLKEPDSIKWIKEIVNSKQTLAIINATSFSCKGEDGISPLDHANVPVFQISLTTNKRKLWKNEDKGLSATDMAMHVAMSEIDGRLFAGIASFKEQNKRNNKLEFSAMRHVADKERICAIVRKVIGWIRLSQVPNEKKKITFILSTYPGKPWLMGHAVGLDVFKSLETILGDLGITKKIENLNIAKELSSKVITIPIKNYEKYLNLLPKKLKKKLNKFWGDPVQDDFCKNGKFIFKAFYFKNCLIALQPERGSHSDRENSYHDLDAVPRHSYVAFYFWLKHEFKSDLIIHVGAHGTLEWLPGKSVGLSNECWPEILLGDIPVIYPFIMNDPGESAQAKRRINALTIGHIPPAIVKAGEVKKLSKLESLLDEFSNAAGLDLKRRDRLKVKIKEEVEEAGLQNILGIKDEKDENEILTKIDKFVCDVKDSQFGEGLHVYGRVNNDKYSFDAKDSALHEKKNLLKAINGKRIDAGVSGSPFRGRFDVLPSGRNLYSNDPSLIPTKSAFESGRKLAEIFQKRYLQDNGEFAKKLLIDLWGSATLRTAGEEFSMALFLLGVKPLWKNGSEKVNGIEVITLAELGRPRVDVTLRVSGLFRDIFPSLTQLYNQSVIILSRRHESPEDNPFIRSESKSRVYGPRNGSYGLNMSSLVNEFSDKSKQEFGKEWIESSCWSINGNDSFKDKKGIECRIKEVESYLNVKDLVETDILLSSDYVKHQGGFLAAKSNIGGVCNTYNIENIDQKNIKIRTLDEELAKIIYSRASNPSWIKSMFKHKFRGAAEIANTFDNMCLFALLTNKIPNELFDIFFNATLNDEEVYDFLKLNNRDALKSMKNNFIKIFESGLWISKRNSTIEKIYYDQ